MWFKGQAVSLPNGKTGIIQEVSIKEVVNGLSRGRDKCKVRYEDGYGGQAEQWFDFDKLNEPKPVQVAIEDKEEELIKVSEVKDREKLDWIQPVVDEKPEELKPVDPVDETTLQG